ncbi:hypothetical protein NQ314_010704 [Rhamnusium bicolor]|uniref:Uncharacterized protein n=1 Tax=Rhamnusium bicolor TaxID=1586634 RepID=A0AAV8XN65_9CUCU|nr:hypothetical protein NQ314_010704 [Rhamnusium bicolor]
MSVDDTLLKVYEFLQRVAVGLEQIVWDQEDKQGQFTKEFSEAEQHLRNVLCELQMAIIDHGLKMRPDITRDVMKDGNRNVDITESKARDWMIFREYMNILEYIIKAFTHMNKL